MLFMAASLETLNLDGERAAMIEEAMLPVIDALSILDTGEKSEGVSLGAINEIVRKLYPDGKFGMGIVPTVLDELETAGVVICIQNPVDPKTNGHIIGTPDWNTQTYRFAEPPGTAIKH